MPRPRINPENRAPEFRVIELSDPVAKPGEDMRRLLSFTRILQVTSFRTLK